MTIMADKIKLCSHCGEEGADRKYLGAYWHKKCLKKYRKIAKGLLN